MSPACDYCSPLALIIEHMQHFLDLKKLRTSEEQGLCVCLGTLGLTSATRLLWSGEKKSVEEKDEQN